MASRGMDLVVETITIDCDDPELVATFWRELLGLEVVPHPTSSIRLGRSDGSTPQFLFTPAGRPTDRKNPWHFDLRPENRDAAVARAVLLGARHADIGQSGDESWVVPRGSRGKRVLHLAVARRPLALANGAARTSLDGSRRDRGHQVRKAFACCCRHGWA